MDSVLNVWIESHHLGATSIQFVHVDGQQICLGKNRQRINVAHCSRELRRLSATGSKGALAASDSSGFHASIRVSGFRSVEH